MSKPIKPRSVNCPKCEKEFCSMCSSGWHPDLTCQENGKKLYLQSKTGEGNNQSLGAIDPLLLFEMDDNIKRCPMCHVPIERDAGCAQMMCKRCKHVFCWFCLKSLDVSNISIFLLIRHLFYCSKSLNNAENYPKKSKICCTIQDSIIYTSIFIVDTRICFSFHTMQG